MTNAIHGLPVDETVFPARDVVELLRALVAIDSVNPSLVPGAAGETAAADFIEDWASHAGLVTHRLEGSPGRPSVIVESRPTSGGKLIAAAGIPTLLFGPNGDGAHGDLEWVSLSGTVACAQTLVAVAERFCR